MTMGQKKSHSFAEAIFNTVFGFAISMAANLIVLPWFGFKVTVHDAFNIGIIFTFISIARSYILRRIFNRLMVWQDGTQRKDAFSDQPFCKWCKRPIVIRNPTGKCDHLYYPENVNKNFRK